MTRKAWLVCGRTVRESERTSSTPKNPLAKITRFYPLDNAARHRRVRQTARDFSKGCDQLRLGSRSFKAAPTTTSVGISLFLAPRPSLRSAETYTGCPDLTESNFHDEEEDPRVRLWFLCDWRALARCVLQSCVGSTSRPRSDHCKCVLLHYSSTKISR